MNKINEYFALSLYLLKVIIGNRQGNGHKPADKSVSYKTTEQTEHERGSHEVGDRVGRISTAQMHRTRQICHQIHGNTHCR